MSEIIKKLTKIKKLFTQNLREKHNIHVSTRLHYGFLPNFPMSEKMSTLMQNVGNCRKMLLKCRKYHDEVWGDLHSYCLSKVALLGNMATKEVINVTFGMFYD